MRRGEVYDARLDPTEGSEQAGTRPVVIVSRDAINAASPVVIVVPCTTYRAGRRLYPSQVVLRAPDERITTLSGGNQQKVAIARWLASNPKVLLLNDPTRGIDIGTKHDLYVLLTQLVNDGLAVVMLSTELDEHVELMDRVLVFREHELFRELDRSELSRNALVGAFFGESGED